VNGLDTLRAAAIALVLMYHYAVVVSGRPTFGFLTTIGWTGVDLFFVLSGYLIGNQIMSPLALGERFSLKTFFARRLLRTLPNYYFVLSLYFLFPALLGGSNTASIWQFLSFTQNIGLHFGETFTHSWSLCIEEQFYLILPLVAVMIATLPGSLRWAWLALGAAVIAGMALRGMVWVEFGRNLMTSPDFSSHIYYSSFARFDELLPGVAIAMLKNFRCKQYAQITAKGNTLLACGMSMFAATAYLFTNYQEIDGYGYSFLVMTFGYPLLATSFGLLTLSALSENSLLNRLRVPGAEKLALWSYAVYLVHKPMFKVLIAPLESWGVDINAPAAIAIIMLLSLLGGWLVYRLVETPFMTLRARWFQVNRDKRGNTYLAS
jgi:peptidoglycan/LPS O-acetylase OafA/YrhL